MSSEKVKKIYRRKQALVSSDLIIKSDAEIDEAVYEPTVGMLIYTADGSMMKRKGLDGRWVEVISTGGGGGTVLPEGYDRITEPEIDGIIG